MVVVTQGGVTMDVDLSEGVNFWDRLRHKLNSLADGCTSISDIMSHEKYLEKLVDHYRAYFPLSSVLATNRNHTISG